MITQIKTIEEVKRFTVQIKSEEETSFVIGQKWINTDTQVEGCITGIGNMTVSLDDGKGKLSSVEHMNRKLWRHLVKIGVYKRVL
jgi:hypothetical protein